MVTLIGTHSPPLVVSGIKAVDAFLNRRVAPEMMINVAEVLIAVGVLALVILAVNALRDRGRRKREVPSGWVVNAREVRNILENVASQRNKVELQFHAQDISRKLATGPIESLNKDTLTLAVGESELLSPSWIGRTVECYLRVNKSSSDFLFFHFSAEITDVSVERDNQTILTLSYPKKLQQQQKRDHLRIEPPYQLVLGLALWPERATGPVSDSRPMKEWGQPVAAFLPERQDSALLTNLSAGGLRVLVRRSQVKKYANLFQTGQRFAVLLDLHDPDKGTRIRTLSMVEVRNAVEDMTTRHRELGMQFVNLARTRQAPENGVVQWRNVSENGVDVLTGWIMKRHMELYREKGFA